MTADSRKLPEEILSTLAGLGKELTTQDNLGTSYPLYEVQEKRWIVNIIPACADEVVWMEDEGGESFTSLDEALEAQRNGDIGSFAEVGRNHHWTHVQTFLTRTAAETFIQSNHYNYEELRVYVQSAHRNPEMKLIRECLVKLHEALK